MSAFKSAWLDWQPTKIPTQRTDKADKSPSVSSVSASPKHLQPENDDPGITDIAQKPLTHHTDKADKRLRGAAVEARAHEAAIARWLIANPPQHADPDKCGACDAPLNGRGLPLAVCAAGSQPSDWRSHVWVCDNSRCVESYYQKRRAEAQATFKSQALTVRFRGPEEGSEG